MIKDDKWYAVFVITGEEDNVKERLRYKLRDNELQAVVPKRRLRERKDGVWNNVVRKLFPGYVLINGKIDTEAYHFLKEVPGVISILKDNSGPLEIDPKEINIVTRLINDREIIGSSKVLLNGTRITVIDGPLLGMEGLIESVDKRKGRAKVRVSFVGETKLVDLSVNVVETAYSQKFEN